MEVVPISQLPPALLPQVMGRLTENQKRFLDKDVRVAQIGLKVPVPPPKPTPPKRNVKPSGPPAPNATIVGVGDKGGNVIIFYSDGTEEVRTGGTRSWRNHNPGNIVAGQFTVSHGAIGRAGGFGVFPDKATGRAALAALLNGGVYQPLMLDEAIKKYSPLQSGNPTAQYQAFIRNKLGKNGNEILNTFSRSEMNDLVNAIIQFEDWRAGTVRYQKFVNP